MAPHNHSAPPPNPSVRPPPPLSPRPSPILPAPPRAADSTAGAIKLHHKINLALLGLTPAALALSPSMLNMPVDIALGLALPIHGHIGMNLVITDYAKKVFGAGAITPCRMLLTAFTGVTLIGLAKLNLAGPGITETVKCFWRPKAKE